MLTPFVRSRRARALPPVLAAVVVAGVLAGPATADRAGERVGFGQDLASTTAAPYAVLLDLGSGDEEAICSGTILDARHVLTAAHCVTKDEETGGLYRPDEVVVSAGVVNDSTRATPTTQRRGAVALRRHPGYDDAKNPDDVGMITLDRPLDLSGPAVRALALPPVGTQLPFGTPLVVTGFGDGEHGKEYGTLRTTTIPLTPSGLCGTGVPGAFLCTIPSRRTVCSGDSGGTARTGSFVVGVNDLGPQECGDRDTSLYANLSAPEVRTWVDGAVRDVDVPLSAIPRLARGGQSVELGTKRPRVHRGVTCDRGRWSAGATFRYAIFRGTGGKLRASAFQTSARFRVPSSFRGKAMGCLVEATTPGGVGVSGTLTTRRVR